MQPYLLCTKTEMTKTIEITIITSLPWWLSGLRHSAHRPERSARGAEFNPRVGR